MPLMPVELACNHTLLRAPPDAGGADGQRSARWQALPASREVHVGMLYLHLELIPSDSIDCVRGAWHGASG